MPKSSIVQDIALCRDTLTIKKIICFASGYLGWPPIDDFWDGIQADLKDACERGEIPYSKNPSDPRRRFYYIRLHDLRNFLVNQDQRWQPLCDFCRRWEQARGTTNYTAPKHLDTKSRTKGGKAPKYDLGLQQFIDRLFAEFKADGVRLTTSSLEAWLNENVQPNEGYEPEPPIPDCGDIEFYDNKVWWKNAAGAPKSILIKSLERYFKRTREAAPATSA